MATLAVFLLGQPRIEVDGLEVKLKRRKALALLAYLAVTKGRHTRDSLSDLMYPELGRDRAFSDLRVLLSTLRSDIGEVWLQTDRDSVEFPARKGLRVDLWDYDAMTAGKSPRAEAELSSAADLIRGPFLSGFYLKDSSAFEDWQTSEGERIRREQSTVLERLLEAHEGRAEHSAAIEICRKLLTLDPVEEAVHRRLMKLYALSGKRAAALGQYNRCRAILRKELGEEPSRETEDLRRQIAGREISAGPVVHAADFVGRAREMARVVHALKDAHEGRGRILAVLGEAGIGKTRLLEESAAEAAAQGSRVLVVRCPDDAGLPPYWPWAQVLVRLSRQSDARAMRRWAGKGAAALADLAAEVAEALGGPAVRTAPGDPETERFLLFEAVTRALVASSAERSLLVVLDDLHCADSASLRLLEFLAHDLADSRLFVLCACREMAGRAQLAGILGGLGRLGSFERLDLNALDRTAVEELVRVLGGPGDAESLWQRTGGNPLFLVELLRYMRTQHPAPPDGGVPPGVRALIRRRLEGLSADCVDLLEVSAVLGADFSIDTVARVSNRESADSLRILGEASLASIVASTRERPGQFRFSHPLVREALVAELVDAKRVELHYRVALVLEELYGEKCAGHAGELAWHLSRGRPLAPAAKLARYSLLAGEQALGGFAWDDARAHFERGLDAKGLDADDPETAWLRFGLARALTPPVFFSLAIAPERTDSEVRAFSALEAAFAFFERTGDAASAIRVGEHPFVLMSHQPGEHKSLFARAQRLAAPGSHEKARLQWLGARLAYGLDYDYEALKRASKRAITAARSFRDPLLELRAVTWHAWISVELDAPEVSRGLLQRGLELLRRTDDPVVEATLHFRSIHLALLSAAKLAEADAHLRRMHGVTSRLHSDFWTKLTLLETAELAWVRGDWQAVRSASDQALAAETDTLLYRQHLVKRAWMELEVGNRSSGDAFLARFLGDLDRVGIERDLETSIAAAELAGIALLTGDALVVERARDCAKAWLPPGEEGSLSPGNLDDARLWATTSLATLAYLERDRTVARRLRPALQQRTDKFIPGWGSATRLRLIGLLDLTLGDLDEAVEHLGQSLADYRAQRGPNVAWALSQLAEAFVERGRAGDHERAVSFLREAVAIASHLGMRPLEKRIETLLQRARRTDG